MATQRLRLRPKTVTQLKDYIAFLDHYGDADDVLFRGQREDKPLIPKLGRLTPRDGAQLPVTERRLIDSFKRQALPMLVQQPQSEWDWLCVAQHHGLATRLLDWTQNPLAALWFAVAAPANNGQPAVVWAFEPKERDFIIDATDTNPYKVDRTRVFRPRHVARRVAAQSGWFTAHKFMTSNKSFVPLERNAYYSQRLRKVIIPAAAFSALRSDLDRCGINAATLLADLDGLCRTIQWQHSLLEDEQTQ